jgi:hypothetical protein
MSHSTSPLTNEKTGPKESKGLAQSHTDNKELSQSLGLGLSDGTAQVPLQRDLPSSLLPSPPK